MVKIIGVEANHLKFLPMMFIVAFGALFAIDLSGCMVSAALIYSCANIGVTAQTLIVGNLLTKDMAFGTV